ncbi:MAG TPA: tetratricopeptide repeat protein [Candidatus Limnocylindrales bacterium]|nr:tetratricopeptide repeat protein [Candidatus Limnocylindrales bacterium]
MLSREHDPQLEAEGELALARLALDGGDLRHAASHLAGAVALAPTHPEVLETFAQLTADHGAATLDLFPVTGNVYLGIVVAKGYVLALLGRTGEALETLCRASEYDTTGGWPHAPWLAHPAAATAVEPDHLLRSLSHLIRALPGPADEPVRAALRPYLTLTGRVLALHPDDGRLYGFASGLARRIGGDDLATSWARRAVEIEPSSINEMFLGMAYREAGRIGEAVEAMKRAIERDPFHLPLYSDLADLLARNDRLDEGLEWIAQAEAIDPDHDCVVHVGARLRYQRKQDIRHLVRLADYARTHPDNGCHHTDLAQACENLMWLGFLPDASEPCTNLLAHYLAQGEQVTGGVRMALSDLEPPSAIAVFKRALPGSTVTFSRISKPDPRKPARRVHTEVWKYKGAQAIPAVPPPAADAVKAIRDVTSLWLRDPVATYDQAVRLAAVAARDLLGLLVHPPDPNEALSAHPSWWTRGVQAWACLGLLHHRTDEPWPTSTRRRILTDLVYGPEDWVTEAALFALMIAAWVDPSVRADVAGIMSDRLNGLAKAARRRPVTIIAKVAKLALVTPDLDARTRALATAIAAEEAAQI